MTAAKGTRRVQVDFDEGTSLSALVKNAPPLSPREHARQLDATRRLADEHGAVHEMTELRLVSSILVENSRYDTWWTRQILPEQGSPLIPGPEVRPLVAFFVHVHTLLSRYSHAYLGPPFPVEGVEKLPPERAADQLAVVDSFAHEERERELAPYRKRAAVGHDHPAPHHELALMIWYHHFTGSPGSVDEAEAPLRRAIALKPQAHASHGLLGEILLRAGRPRGAVKAFAKAARLLSRHPRYHYCASVALETVGDAVAAKRALARAKRVAGPKLRERFTRASNPLEDYRYSLLCEVGRMRKKREGLVSASAREIAEDERARNTIDLADVPSGLHAVVPLVEKWGLGDDPSRDYLVMRATREEKQEMREACRRYGVLINSWIDSIEPGKETAASTSFLYLLDAWDQLGILPRD